MRKVALTAALLTLALTGAPSSPITAADASTTPLPREGQCRRAPALPTLDPEDQGQRPSGTPAPSTAKPAMEKREGAVTAGPSSPSSVPSPPPPSRVSEPGGAAAADEGGDGEAVVVTAAVDGGSSERVGTRVGRLEKDRDGKGTGDKRRPNAGLLTAGEHDDLLNPELYARYVRSSNLGQQVRDVPIVDTRRVLTIAVNDAAGRPVPFARVTITCADGNSLSLSTMADGTAAFFPSLDRLGDSVTATVTVNGRSASGPRTINIAADSGAQRQVVGVQLSNVVKKLDLAVVIDATGSMADEISFLQAEMREILASVQQRHPQLDIRLGLVAYRDQGDSYVTQTYAFNADHSKIQASLTQLSAVGGGDYPEAMDQALGRAVRLDWREDAVKSILLVADAPPHDNLIGKTWAVAEVAREKRIHITPVAASGVGDTAEYVMRAMAAITQSPYIFLTDDSGIGSPHAAPAIDCYHVTLLQVAVRRVLDSLVAGYRVEPEKAEIIRTVGNPNAGRCVLPKDFDEPQ